LYLKLVDHTFNIFHPYGQFPVSPDGKAPTTNVERFGFAAWDQNTNVAGGGFPGGGAGGMPPSGGSNTPPSGGSNTPPSGGSNAPPGGGLSGPGKGSGSMPPGPGTGGDKSGSPDSGHLRQIYDAIVRFVDVDVKPGHTYKYYIQVRMHNPNYGKKDQVQQQLFADPKELVSDGWTETPSLTVPGTYHLFAVDQFQVDFMGENDPKTRQAKANHAEFKHDKDHAVLQLQRWFGSTVPGSSTTELVGDWAIVERLKVGKGEQIGQMDMIVEIPTWNKGKGGFEMKRTTPQTPKGKPLKLPMNGVELDFVPLAPSADRKRLEPTPPFLVDFDGGKKTHKFTPVPVTEDAAMDVLILMPDGKLIVRNSRADINAYIDDRVTEGDAPTRQGRVADWRKRNQDVFGTGTPREKGTGGGGGILGGDSK
jgi:hypothetical protein